MIPVFVIVRDRLEHLKATVEQLEKAVGIDIVLVDNQSTYEPTVEWLKGSSHKVVFLNANVGHHSPWQAGLVPSNSFYGVTDPDIRLVKECPADWPAFLVDVLETFPDRVKAGVSLKLSNIPDKYFLKSVVVQHESQFYNRVLGSCKNVPIYDAGVDTTLAIYRKKDLTPDDLKDLNRFVWPSVRAGWPYTAEHLAWYVDSNNLSEEEIFYRSNADKVVASWAYSKEY
jgi:hypothetical protein